MNCYEIHGTTVSEGLRIVYGKDRPHVLVGHKKIYLSAEVVECKPGDRLLCCGVDTLWKDVKLVPETEYGEDGVLVSLNHWTAYEKTSIVIESAGYLPGDYRAPALVESVIDISSPDIRKFACCALVKMRQNQLAVALSSWTEKLPKPAGWRHWFARNRYCKQSTAVKLSSLDGFSRFSILSEQPPRQRVAR